MKTFKPFCWLLLLQLSCFGLGYGQSSQKEAWKKEIMETDRAFSKLSSEKGVNYSFLEYIDSEGVMLKNDMKPIIGKAAAEKFYQGKDDTAYQLTWEPSQAEVADSGELGYSFGVWTLATKEGKKMQGHYVSIWKKGKDGKWKFVLDTGTSGLGE